MNMKKKNSIKRAQSQARLSFAERKNFRPMAKILTLLVLLMTAVTGAVAQSYEAKVFDLPASWASDNTPISAADMPEDFVQITFDEAKALAVPDGNVFLLYGFNGDKVKTIEFISGNFNEEAERQIARKTLIGAQTGYNYIFCYPAAASAVPVTEVTKNQWQFTMPDYDVVAKIEYDTELALSEATDNTTVLADWDGYEADVTLQRTLVAGSWNTLAVPFNVEATWLAYLKSQYAMEVKLLTSTSISGETIYLNFEDAQTIEAGKPYLVKVTSDFDFSAQAFPGIEVSKELNPVQTDYVDFIPTLGKTLVTGPEGDKSNTDAVLFLAAGNLLKHPDVVNEPEQQSSYLKGFRAYFQLKGEAASLARAFSIDFGDGETTGIIAIDNGQLIMDNEVYDLQGRRVSGTAQKGVYIVNGKKTIIK